MIINTKKSLEKTQEISDLINDETFHHHYYVLMDIANTMEGEIDYLEIGCYGGGSASLMLNRPNTNVYSIDLGQPIPKEHVLSNIEKTNVLKNKYEYIQGDSHLMTTKEDALKLVEKVDILFIDGDHSFNGVIQDYDMYIDMVKDGGYIVFDDYNDSQFSPEVKIAVDSILARTDFNFQKIGCLPNIHNARPTIIKDGNCYIVRKLKM